VYKKVNLLLGNFNCFQNDDILMTTEKKARQFYFSERKKETTTHGFALFGSYVSRCVLSDNSKGEKRKKHAVERKKGEIFFSLRVYNNKKKEKDLRCVFLPRGLILFRS